MRLHVVACQVFSRELCAIAAQSSHVVELDLLPQGLHDTPALLREMVGEAIQKVEGRYQKGISKYLPDAIILGYGLCSNGVVGLQAGKIPLVIPRTDACMGIFLGSQRRYLDLFHQYPGIYWLNHGWIENAFIPTKEQLEKKYQQYREQYGEDNAEYLQQEDRRWISSYQYCGYIRSNGPWEREEYRKLAHQTAVDHGWKSVDLQGDSSMLERLLQGEWRPEECLICPPGYRVEASYDETKIKAVEGKPQEGKEICQKF